MIEKSENEPYPEWPTIHGQESLEEIAQLQVEAKGKAQGDAKNSAAGLTMSVLDKMIAEAPDQHEQADLPVDLTGTAAPAPPTNTLLTAHGWPKRYVEPVEIEGGAWKASFALSLPVIEAGGILILHGKRGTGKTRMAAEIARHDRFPCDQVKGRGAAGTTPDPKRTPLYRTAMEFFIDVRSTYGKTSDKTEKAVVEHLATSGLLVIDELQERGATPFEDRLLTHLIDRRYGAMLPTILISNLTQAEIGPALGASIIDRYAENGRRIEFTWDSYRRAKR